MYRLSFIGFGNVGRALALLLIRKQQELLERYGITFIAAGIYTAHHGWAIDPQGINLAQAVERVQRGESLDALCAPSYQERKIENSFDFIRNCPADVLFENTPVNHVTGEPAVSHLRLALEQNMHAITANKGAVVFGYHELHRLARRKGRAFFFESTVMDGAPIFSLFRAALPAANLRAFRGVLNSTTNLILTRMEENGESFEQAVQYAQQIGIAETDPSADVDGWDAAIKVAALVTVLMDFPLKPQEVEREGIREITPEKIAEARAEGKRWKLICTAERNGSGVKAKVMPQKVGPESPFYAVRGTTSIIEFQTDVLGDLSIIETDPGPETTAYGLLSDFINAVSGPLRGAR
ncbi:MAG: homoserine dehydrogenase [Anaerolineales bacterium]